MFDNIGSKIKTLSKVICWAGIAISVITGIAMLLSSENENGSFLLTALLCLLVGPLSSWIGSFFIYGFGELIEKTCSIERSLRGDSKSSDVQAKDDSERITKLTNLRAQGLITEEEYQKLLNKEKI